MINDVLIFRTDRIGDLLVTCPAILTIKDNIDNCEITLVTSKKSYDYAKSFNIFKKIYVFPADSLINKIIFIYKLSRKRFKYIFVFDGKDRSIISSLFINSKLKIAVFSKKKNNFFYKLFKIKFVRDDERTDLMKIFREVINYCIPSVQISNYDFLTKKENNNFSSNLSIKNYIHLHLDEKWIRKHYISSYTDINPSYNEFTNFINNLAKDNSILITTGLIDFDLITDLKNNFFKKSSDKIYYRKHPHSSIYLIYKPSLEDLESLTRESKIFVSCHCGFTHVPNSFNIKIIDIIEKSKKEWYGRYTLYLKNYKQIERRKFSEIKDELLNNILNK